MNSNPKYLLLVSGIPASGKSHLAHQLAAKFAALSINNKILSTDNL
jgi:adenylylsulfate kinase-like enzyme